MTFLTPIARATVSLLALLAVTTLASLFATPRAAFSQSTNAPITGYAWSDTIGWIELNCTDTDACGESPFGFSVDADGTVTGYAWSDSIGWVSANPSDLAGCPSAPCTATIGSNGTLSGWLRALSGGTDQSGGWDGFISLGGPNYGVSVSGGTFSGYAWGDMNLGWLDFEYATTTRGTCTPAYSCSGNTIQYTASSCVVTDVAACNAPEFCSPGNAQCLYPSMSYSSFTDQNGMQRSGNLQAAPSLVPLGQETTIFWNVENAQSCLVSGSNGDGTGSNATGVWNTASSGESGKASSAIEGQTIYTLTCIDDGGATTTEQATVNVTPGFREI